MSDRIAGDPRFVVIAQADGSFAVVQDDETTVARFSLTPKPVPPGLDFAAALVTKVPTVLFCGRANCGHKERKHPTHAESRARMVEYFSAIRRNTWRAE